MEEDDESCLGHVKLKAYGRYVKMPKKASSCVRRAGWRAPDKM